MKQLFFWMCIFYSTCVFAAPEMKLTPQTVSYGERVQLILSDDKAIKNMPDLSVLQNDFIIRGQQQMESTSIINGVKTETHQLILSLFPKKKGTLTIGPFEWNGTQLPAQNVLVTEQTNQTTQANSSAGVLPAAPSMNAEQNATVQNRIFEAQGEIEPKQIYEGESALYTIRLTENIGLTQAQIQTPNTTQYTLTPFGQDKMNRTMSGETPVQIYERTFLLTPNETGKFDLTGGVLGLVPDTSAPRTRPFGAFPDFFGNDDFFNQAFGVPQKEVYAGTNTASLTVKPKPTDWSGWWLPSQQVVLKEQFDISKEVRVGQPLERHVQLTALGVDGNKLPLMTQPVNQSIKAYANPDKRTVIDSKSGPVGVEEITFVIVPTETGEITIPGIQVGWFDTKNEKRAVAELSAKKIHVVPDSETITKENNTEPQTGAGKLNTPVPSSSVETPSVEERVVENQSVEADSVHQNNTAKTSLRGLEKIYEVFGVFELILAVCVIALFSGLFFYMKSRRNRKRYLNETDVKKSQKSKKPLPDLYPFE